MTEPGWYRDRADPELARWHDGTAWTEHTMVMADWKGSGVPPPPQPVRQAWVPAPAPEPAFEPAAAPPRRVARQDARADAAAERARAKAMRPWYQKKRFIIPLVLLLFAVIGGIAAGSGSKDDNVTASGTGGDKAVATTTTLDPYPNETPSQEQARRKAADYLGYSSFSRTGLIKQLEFEGFSTADATYGTDAQQADWNAQAAQKAKDYLDYTSFSHSGLVAQLKFDGFTAAEAEYGASSAGI